MRAALALAALGTCLPLAANAQTVSSIKLEPAAIKAGESVTATVGFEVESGINCGLRMHWGDGSTQDFKINQQKDVPLVVTRAYANAGRYEIKAEPKTQGFLPKCLGKNQVALLEVAAPPAPVAAPGAAKPAAAAAPQCPEGWTLNKKSVSKKTGAYTCTAKAGTKPPEARLACPGDLSYFENVKKGQLGCKP
jgi:hypothetical protein